MAFWAPLLTLGVGEVAVKADSLSWVSPDVDAEQLDDDADAAGAKDWKTIGPSPKNAVKAAAVQPTKRARCRAWNRPVLVLDGPPPDMPSGMPGVVKCLSMAPLPWSESSALGEFCVAVESGALDVMELSAA
jgi:hypothetical protein